MRIPLWGFFLAVFIVASQAELLIGQDSDSVESVSTDLSSSSNSSNTSSVSEVDGSNKSSESESVQPKTQPDGLDDEAPQNSPPPFSTDRPPQYSHLPTVTSIAISPDGSMLAVPGFHEVVILATPGSQDLSEKRVTQANMVNRLIGQSSRITSIKFSPDGTQLAAAGGCPGEFGEIQIWDAHSGELKLSKIVSNDTLFGVNWSPDGSLISFGSTDTNLRAIDSETGEQRLFQGAHEDWIRDTVFSNDGDHLVSVGRDMTCKLTIVETQRFVDNITSITPGALKGGIGSVDRHPNRNEILIGGADGIPKLYRMERVTKRVIGDDANLIRNFPKIEGRIHSVSISQDASKFLAASSLDGIGYLQIYSYKFDTSLPDEIKKIIAKRPVQHTAKEKKLLADHLVKDTQVLSSAKFDDSSIYSAEFSPDGRTVICGGADGYLYFVDSALGAVQGKVKPFEISEQQLTKATQWNFHSLSRTGSDQDLTNKVSAIEVIPASIVLDRVTDYAQLVVTAVLKDGDRVDITGIADYTLHGDSVHLNGSLIEAAKAGKSALDIRFDNQHVKVNVAVQSTVDEFAPDFIQDVNPVLTKLGCNAGTCHGGQAGKNGFKLSLRGYDPIYDIRSLTDDMGARRINRAVSESSLMLLKPTGLVPHEGGELIDVDSKYYNIIRQWIKNGAKLDLSKPKVASIEVFPQNPVLKEKDWVQKIRVEATYADGVVKDVTREAFIEIGDQEIASIRGSSVKALRRGETPVLARFEGAYAATTLTVMGDRTGFVWEQPETWGPIDEIVASKWKRMK
ncbi:MAG: hypothetical protein AAF623_14850, partial [Planctomycetota bacterium]